MDFHELFFVQHASAHFGECEDIRGLLGFPTL